MQASLCLAQLVVRPSHVLNQFLKVHILLELNVSKNDIKSLSIIIAVKPLDLFPILPNIYPRKTLITLLNEMDS